MEAASKTVFSVVSFPKLIFDSELELMDFAIENYNTIEPRKQPNVDGTCWSKRSPKDSEIDVNKRISEQFDLIRVCDPDRFPAFFIGMEKGSI